MQVFVTGITGYIGRVVGEKLLAKGYEVIGLARSDQAAQQLKQAGFAVHRGDLNDSVSLAAGAKNADAVIHIAASREADAGKWEREGVVAMLDTMIGTQKAFVYTSGASVVGAAQDEVFDETYPIDPNNFRGQIENSVRSYSEKEVRVIVIRPSFVYGRGGGILARYLAYAQASGIAGYVLPGDNRWPFIHVDDLAELYVLALEKAASGEIYNGVTGSAIEMRSIGQTIAQTTGAKLTGWTPGEATPVLGGIANVLAINLNVSGQKAVRELGWQPLSPSIFEEIKSISS